MVLVRQKQRAKRQTALYSLSLVWSIETMAKTQVMTIESFQKKHNQAVRTLIGIGLLPNVTDPSEREAYREAYAKEVAESYNGAVSPEAVLLRWGQVKAKGGFLAIPEGVKGKRTNMEAVNAETAATRAALDAAGVAYSIDDKGNIVIS